MAESIQIDPRRGYQTWTCPTCRALNVYERSMPERRGPDLYVWCEWCLHDHPAEIEDGG